MAKYVDIDAVKEAVRGAECDADWDGRRFDAEFIENALDFIPAADVAPVRHGEWRLVRRMAACGEYECSVCGRIETFGCFNKPENNPYCHCGAKMDLEAK